MAVNIENIPLLTDELELGRFLEDELGTGSILSCKIKIHTVFLRSMGFGTVSFKDKETAQRAVTLAKSKKLLLYNRALRVSYLERDLARQLERKSFVVESGRLYIGSFQSESRMISFWNKETDKPIILNLKLPSRKLDIRVTLPGDMWPVEYKLEFGFDIISELVAVSVLGKNTTGFLLQSTNPPLIYNRRTDHRCTGDPYIDMIESCLSKKEEIFNEDQEEVWVRTTDFTAGYAIGRSLSYCLGIPVTSSDVVTMENFIFAVLPDSQLSFFNPVKRIIDICVSTPCLSTELVVPILNLPEWVKLPWHVIFKLNSLLQLGKLNEPTLDEEFYKLLQPDHPSDMFYVDKLMLALEELSKCDKLCYHPVKFIMEHLERFDKSNNVPRSISANLGKHQLLIYRLLVTPTKVYCVGPEVELSNRIVRHYQQFKDNFLRVTFVDENKNPLLSTALMTEMQTSHSDVYKRMRTILKEGIHLGGKKFEFLAFSASQLRQSSLWMFSSSGGITVDTVRSWMGNFLQIRNVAKCSARMGQAFSSSTKTLMVHPRQVRRIPDIEVVTNSTKYCFSDGIGQISKTFAQSIARECGLPPGDVPSGFQIRYGGYKGVVGVTPTDNFSVKLLLRPSMCKFDSADLGLDVLEWTRALPCYLNRQIITLLSTLGVGDDVFVNLQSQTVSNLNQMLDDRKIALEVLQETDLIAVQMLRWYNPVSEPFLMRLLHNCRSSLLLDLRKRARIPLSKGKILMGCLDEKAILKYGEVFVKISNRLVKEASYPFVVTGKVVVAKNPCLHPGDVRVLEAVNVPQLGHMVDCVVFPQCGPRPHPNECSGSDLDGDLYFVSWEQSLIPPSVDPPMDYTAAKEKVVNSSVTIEEIQEFFVDFNLNNSLGLISNAHIVHADREQEKARNFKCLQLAHLASVAVDFPKTGVPAVMPTSIRPKEYPDFLEKEEKVVYKSPGILGQLFRAIKDIPISAQPTFTREDMKKYYDKELVVDGFERYEESAMSCKRLYDGNILGLMNQYGIEDEAEIVSGFSQKRGKEQIDAKDRMLLAYKAVQKEARGWFYGSKMTKEEEFAKASAWYHVTYYWKSAGVPKHGSKFSKRNIQLLSFPWVVHDVLLLIKQNACSHRATFATALKRAQSLTSEGTPPSKKQHFDKVRIS